MFDSWASLGRTALNGVVAYVVLIAFLRISGKRTLAKLNAFDLVVTVALGSTLGSVLTSEQLPLANGILALGLLVLLQYGVAWTTVRAAWARRLIKSEPALLLYRGRLIPEALRRARIDPDGVLAAVRGAGHLRLADVGAVVLESDGSLSVLRELETGADATSLRNVRRPAGTEPLPEGDSP
jgi:uncharacterized membrane protein YcaP (DUF421 family)